MIVYHKSLDDVNLITPKALQNQSQSITLAAIEDAGGMMLRQGG
jgi:hypothetical protein